MSNIDNEIEQKRISLTKKQIQTTTGAELLSLCQSIVEDGSISVDELKQLKHWLDSNHDFELPSINFLHDTVNNIIADKKVTKEEWKELYIAIEKILPPEIRKTAKENRLIIEKEKKEQEKIILELEKQKCKEEKLLNRPICSLNFMIAGAFFEGRPLIIKKYANELDQVYLIRDRQNKYSRNAVEVRLQNGMLIGFIPEDRVEEIASLFDDNLPHYAYITKILTGGRNPIPVVQAYVYKKESTEEDIVFEKDVPQKTSMTPKKTGCLTVLFILITILFLVLK
jgi:hypothetical protein